MSLKKLFLSCVVVMLVVLRVTCIANPKGAVNILAWYNYLDSPQIASVIKDRCGVEISYDKYHSTADFLERISRIRDFYDYDIIIFPNEAYELVKERITTKNSTLNKVAEKYSGFIKKHYWSQDYPSNVVYFVLTVTGFVWNPKIVSISGSDSISSMFGKAGNNIVILINTPVGVRNLVDNKNFSHNLFVENFKKIARNANLYITNGYNILYSYNNFSYAFQGSGEAITTIEKSKNDSLAFLIHPRYSYIAPDLMAELNTRKETKCVARVLVSREVSDIIQKKTGCLSPYSTLKAVKDPLFRNIYKQLLDKMPKLTWIDSFLPRSKQEYNRLRIIWNKIHMLPKVVNNHTLVLKCASDCCSDNL